MKGPSNRWLLALLVLGLVLRVGFDLATRHARLLGDEVNYDQIAWNVATGHGFSEGTGTEIRQPTARIGPGYVLLVAAAHRLAGHRKLPILLIQALIDTLSIAVVWRIGRRIFASSVLALGGALIYTVYPPFILMAGHVATETYSIATLLLGIHFGLEWAEDGRWRSLAASGIAIGLCALSKPQMAVVAVLIVLAGRPKWWSLESLSAAVAQAAIVTVVLSPWIVRNALTFHAFIPGATQGGVTFWGGTGPANGRVIGGLVEPGVPPHVLEAIRGRSELERDRWFYAEGLRVVHAAPMRYAGLVLRKFVRLWFNLLYDRPPSRASLAAAAFNLVALVLAGWSLARLRPRPAAVRLLIALFAYFSVIHMLFFSTGRYAMPCYAYIFSFSGAAAAAIIIPGLLPRSAAAGAPGSGRPASP